MSRGDYLAKKTDFRVCERDKLQPKIREIREIIEFAKGILTVPGSPS